MYSQYTIYKLPSNSILMYYWCIHTYYEYIFCFELYLLRHSDQTYLKYAVCNYSHYHVIITRRLNHHPSSFKSQIRGSVYFTII